MTDEAMAKAIAILRDLDIDDDGIVLAIGTDLRDRIDRFLKEYDT